jgi:peptidoglycan/LPS O-acetylase OafA/YrhL
MVVLSHSFALVGAKEPLIGGNTFGGTGVWIFFILSGFLIATSWDQYPRLNVFLAKRALRIFPGLAVAVLLTIVVCGLFYTSLGLIDYATNTSTITYINNILLYNTQFALPGVFTDNPFPRSVNGSLWTLAYEFTMYLTIAAIGVLKIYKKVSISKIWIGLIILQIIVLLIGPERLDFSVFYIRFDRIVTLSLMFMTGVLFYKLGKKIPIKISYGVAALVLYVLIVTIVPDVTQIAAATLLAYAIFALGSSPLFSPFGKYGDFSYGIYIYSFPIQQMIAASILPTSPYLMFAMSLPISVALGAASWWLIESRALKLKSKIPYERYPIKQADEAW